MLRTKLNKLRRIICEKVFWQLSSYQKICSWKKIIHSLGDWKPFQSCFLAKFVQDTAQSFILFFFCLLFKVCENLSSLTVGWYLLWRSCLDLKIKPRPFNFFSVVPYWNTSIWHGKKKFQPSALTIWCQEEYMVKFLFCWHALVTSYSR